MSAIGKAKAAGLAADKLALMEIKYYKLRNQSGDIQKAYDICKAQLLVVEADALMQLELGLLSYSMGRVNEAKEALEKAIEYKPSLSKAKYYLGEISVRTLNHAEALGYFRDAYQLDNSNSIYLNRYLQYEGIFGNLERVIQIREALADRMPEQYDNRLKLVYAYSKEKQYSKALVVADKLIKDTEAAGVSISLRSKCVTGKTNVLLALGKFEDAKFYWQEFIAGIGNDINANVYVDYAQFFMNNKMLDEARVILQSAISIEDEKVRNGSMAMVALMSGAGRQQEMFKHLEGLLALMPEKYLLHKYDVMGSIRLGEFEKASEKLKSYQAKYEYKSEYAGLEAELAMKIWLDTMRGGDLVKVLSESRKALEQMNKTIGLNRLPKYLVYRTTLRQNIRNIPGATDDEKNVFSLLIKDLEDAVAKEPRNFKWRSSLGLLYLNEGMTSKALAEYNKILKVSPSHLATIVALSGIYDGRLGQSDRAVKVFLDGIKADPKSMNLKYNLGMLYKKLKQFGKAERLLETVYQNQIKSIKPHLVLALTEVGLAKGTPGKVLVLLSKHVEMVRKFDKLMGYRAMALWRTKKQTEAIGIFSELIKRAKSEVGIIETSYSVAKVMGNEAGSKWLHDQADSKIMISLMMLFVRGL